MQKVLETLMGEEEYSFTKGTNIKILFPKEISNELIITAMAREFRYRFFNRIWET